MSMAGEWSRRLFWTVHARERSRQRAIAPRVAELAYVEGRWLRACGNSFILTVERVRELRQEAAYPARLLAAAEKAAPIVVVVEDASTMITVFRAGRGIVRSWRRSRGHSRSAS